MATIKEQLAEFNQQYSEDYKTARENRRKARKAVLCAIIAFAMIAPIVGFAIQAIRQPSPYVQQELPQQESNNIMDSTKMTKEQRSEILKKAPDLVKTPQEREKFLKTGELSPQKH